MEKRNLAVFCGASGEFRLKTKFLGTGVSLVLMLMFETGFLKHVWRWESCVCLGSHPYIRQGCSQYTCVFFKNVEGNLSPDSLPNLGYAFSSLMFT